MDIKSIYHDYLVHLESKRDRTKNKFHASAAGSCYRKQMYSYYDFPQDTKDDRSYRLLRLGTIVHEDIENAIMHYGNQGHGGRIYVEHDVAIEPLNLVGTFDFGEMIKENGKTTFNLYDIKTTAMWTWTKMFGRIGNRVAGTDTNYRLQLATYALAVDYEHAPNTMNMYLVWYKKNDSYWRETLIGDEWVNKALEYWTELNEILDDCGEKFEEDLVPGYHEGVPFQPEWECGWCPYYSICPSDLADKRRK